jgi:hypothetical protein
MGNKYAVNLCASIKQVRYTIITIPNRFSLTLYALFLIALISSISLRSVFGDGLFQEQLSGSFRDRKADLIIKMTPPVVTTENQKPSFSLNFMTLLQMTVINM